MKGPMATLVIAGLLLQACAAGPAATPSPTPSDPVDKSNFKELDRAAGERLFQLEELPFPVVTKKGTVLAIGFRLLQACNAELPTDKRVVTQSSAMWQSVATEQVAVDQTIIAYDRPVGRQARDEARAALATCKSYTQLDRVFEQLEQVDVTEGSAVAFCEWVRMARGGTANAEWRCTLIVGEGDLACSVRTWSKERDQALASIRALRSLTLQKCRRNP